ncbi:MAG: ATP-binding cassette domain-containing protein [Lachnospiraceae bacterium]|nr:ATP-binding cassette domain-containing protein [Lachnospiraceae bacterium]
MYMKSIRDFMECPVEKGVEDGILPGDNMGEISFENVSYHYAGSEQTIIKNLKVRQGEHIALVGENGAGKTTLTKLLMRLYDATEGEIRYSGTDIRHFTTQEYRELFGSVFQDYQIYAASVQENVMMHGLEEGEGERTVC